jgi:hypothetical protein
VLAFNGIDAAEKALLIVGGDCACARPVHANVARRITKIVCVVRLAGFIDSRPSIEDCLGPFNQKKLNRE